MQIEVPDFWLFTIFILIEQLHMLYAFIIQFHNYRFRAVFAVVNECVPLLFPVRKAGSVIPDDHIRMRLTFVVKQNGGIRQHLLDLTCLKLIHLFSG